MKFKNFLIISLAIMCSLTIVFETLPLIDAYSARSGYTSDFPSDGSYLIYGFSDQAVYSYINGTPTSLMQTGAIKITVQSTGVIFSIIIKGPPYQGTPTGFKYTQIYSNKTYLPLSNPFVSNFINQISLNPGHIDVLDGEVGIAATPLSTYYYFISYSGSNKTLMDYSRGMGYTSPSVLYFPNFKENSSSVNLPYGNFYQYDQADGWNLLVCAPLVGGTIGISPFLQQLLNDTNVNLPVLGVYSFNLYLVGTNIALQPLALQIYLTEYLFLVIVIWVLGGTYIYITYRMAKAKSRDKK